MEMTQEELYNNLIYGWDQLVKFESFNINGEVVVRREAAERLAAAIGIVPKRLYKDYVNLQDLLEMYMNKAQISYIIENQQHNLPVSVTINWREPISISDFDKEQLSPKEIDIANTEQVIYIFEGYKNDKTALDAGQTSRTLAARTKEHIGNKDYLEGFPYKQCVYCGEVTCKEKIDRALLEQIEGAIIQYLYENKGDRYICNKQKIESYSKPYNITEITNQGLAKELKDILPETINELY